MKHCRMRNALALSLFSLNLFIIILFLSSCSSNNSTITDFNTGYKSIEVELEPLSNPVRRNSLLPLKLTIKNDGASDSNARFQLTYPFPYLSFSKSEGLKCDLQQDNSNLVDFSITNFKGKSLQHSVGDRIVGLVYLKPNLPTMQSEKDCQINLDYCYNYSILVNVPLCINPDYQLTAVEPACTVEPISLSGGQGSVVSVTRIEPVESLSNNKVRITLKVYLTNHGNGKLVTYDNGNLDNCFSVQDENLNIDSIFKKKEVKIRELRIGAEEKITNQIVELFEDNSFEITLTLDDGNYNGNAYKTSLSMVIDYIYKDSDSVTVTVI